MRIVYWLRLKLRSLFSREEVEQDLDDELAFYLEQRTAHEISLGRSPEAAAGIARQALGGIELRKEECRDQRGTRWIENFEADLRHGFRSWRKTPGIWALATLTLGLGIGANATVISIVDKIYNRPFASLNHETDRVLRSGKASSSDKRNTVTLDDYLAWRTAPVFEKIIAYKAVEYVISGVGDPERIVGQAVSPGFFSTLGAKLVLGRFPLDAEHQPEGPKLIVLSHDYWQNRFAGSPAAIGRSIRLDGVSFTIVGVAEKDFWFPSVQARFWTPLLLAPAPSSHKEPGLQVIARLNPGIGAREASSALAPISLDLERRFPDTHNGVRVQILQLFDGFYSQNDGKVIVLLYLISGGILLIACANVANLLMVRGLARQREMSIRIALGAARSRILAQSLTEGLLLALPALAFSTLAAHLSSTLLLSQARVPFPVDGPVLDPHYLFINGLVALGSIFLFSLYPAWAATAIHGDTSNRNTLSRGTQRATGSLVVVQVALGLALVMTAILGERGVEVLLNLDPGYDRTRVLQAEFYPSRRSQASDAAMHQLHQRLLDRSAASTEFQSVGLISPVPVTNAGDGIPTRISPLHRQLSIKDSPQSHYGVMSPGALETLRIPLLRGRAFTTADSATTRPVAIVNQKLAEQLFPGQDPVGKSIRVAALASASFEIVGLYPNLDRENTIRGPISQFYVPFSQAPRRSMQWVGRFRTETAAIEVLRAAAREVDPEAPLEVDSLTHRHFEELQNSRVLIYLISAFAVLALFFGGCGLFAVVSQTVSQRLPEIGLRMALGASGGRIGRWVLGSGFRLLALGSFVGVGGGLLLGSLLATQLVKVTPYDWQVILPSALSFVAVGLLACFAPALRAARTDITRVIRQD